MLTYDAVGNRTCQPGAPYTYDTNGNTTGNTYATGSTTYRWVVTGFSSYPPPTEGEPPARGGEANFVLTKSVRLKPTTIFG